MKFEIYTYTTTNNMYSRKMNGREKSVTLKVTKLHPIVHIFNQTFSESIFKDILSIVETNIFEFIQIIDSMKLTSDGKSIINSIKII
jgi:hypothetical protein